MKRSPRLLALVLMLAVAAFGAAQVAAQSPGSVAAPVLPAQANAIRDQYVVVLKEGANPRAVAAVAQANPKFVYEAALNGFAAELNAGQLTALQHNPNVAYIEQDQTVSISTTQSGATWGLDRINARSGTDGTFTYTRTGKGVTVYIIDTGIDVGHSEFTGRLSTAYYDAFSDGRRGDDCNGHGTHVAGTAGGTKYGVAKGVTLVRVRVLDCNGSGAWSGVIAGMDWVTSRHAAGTPAVANLSLNSGASSSVDAATNRMIDDGVVVAVAAGNSNADACNYSPARVSRALTIGATTSGDAKASWSNYGSCLDWFAPGQSITSAWIGSGSTEIKTMSGTSMAAPHTAGVAALYLQGNPSASPQSVRTALYDATTKRIVTSSSTGNNHLLYTNY